jgi:uncharacterized protein involved in type VI secretion and phage assembly
MAVVRIGRRRPPDTPAYRSNTSILSFLDDLRSYGLEMFGRFYGVYRAFVVANEDPDAPGQPDPHARLRVRVPIVGDRDNVSRLAWPIVPLAGNGFGLKSLPPVDSQVYVMFEAGRLDAPIWLGGWWGDGQMPSGLAAAEQHGWVTPEGNKIIFDGTSGAEAITVERVGGGKVEIDSSGNVTVENKSGAKVYVGNGAANSGEPSVLGDTLKGLLESMCDALTALTVTVPAFGTSGTPVNAAQFSAIKARLRQILSQTVEIK